MERSEIIAEVQHIYNSWVVRYGTPPETMAAGMRDDMNAYFDSINYRLIMGPCLSLTDVLTQLTFVGITGIDRPDEGA